MEQKEETKLPDFFKLPDKFDTLCDKLLYELSKEVMAYFQLKGPAAVKYREKYYVKFYQILIRCSLDKLLDEKSDLVVVKRVMETLVIMYHVFNKFSEFRIDKQMNSVMTKAINDSKRTYNRVRTYHNITAMERARFDGTQPVLWPTWLDLVRPLERKWHKIRTQYDKGYAKRFKKRYDEDNPEVKQPDNERKIIYPFSHRKKYKSKKTTKRKIGGTHIQYLIPIQHTQNQPLLKL